MENTQGGKIFNNWDDFELAYPEWKDRAPVWKALSAEYANGATGKVIYVHPSDYLGKVWQEIELPILQDSILDGKVTFIEEVFVNAKK